MKPACVLVLLLGWPAAGWASDALEAFLSKDPSTAARAAFEAGDARHIVVPVCLPQGGEVVPGWPLDGPTPPGMWEALKNGRRPFECDALGDNPRSPRFQRLLRYAEQYNRTLIELERQRGVPRS